MRQMVRIGGVLIALIGVATPAAAFRPLPLSAPEQKVLRDNFGLCTAKLKGPYTENFCICPGGVKLPVRGPGGQIRTPCKSPVFCAAFRAPWAETLANHRMYIANIFSRDLYLWDSFPDHNDLVRGYILEQYFTETNPHHKLSQLKAFGGLSGAEDETPAAARFFERYLSAPEFNDHRDFLLAYELQRRFFVRADLGQIEKVRALSVRIQQADPKFKPLRDAVHNQISAGLVPQLVAFRDPLSPGPERTQVDELISEITKLTSLSEIALAAQVAEIEDAALRGQLSALIPAANADAVDAIASLAQLMVLSRETVAAGHARPADSRRLVDLNITAAGVIQQRGNALLEGTTSLSVRQHLRLLSALTEATYGTGLLGDRERAASLNALRDLLAAPKQSRQDFVQRLKEAERAVEWAQGNAALAFAEVWAPWTFLLPKTVYIRDDILRSSPLLLYAQVSRRLDDYAAGTLRPRHDLFGTAVDSDVRALNPGLAMGRLRVAPKEGAYTRDEIVELPDTPADLEPAAGILTQGEGNVLSHVQLLARALGIPNVVLGPSAYRIIAPHDGQQVFFIVTPGGRVIIKDAAAMTAQDRAVFDEYTRNRARRADGSLAGGGPRLHIDRAKIDLSKKMPIDLNEVRRKDSGRFCGPKAAYLGELKHLFPEHVARGIVVPFGAYYEHYRNATVAVPETLRSKGLAQPGEHLADFVERTYKEFFDVMIPAQTADAQLSAWIKPRLDIMRYSIRQAPLSPALTQAIRDGLDRAGLLKPDDPSQSVGCFVRSDTNVEDLDNFNGAGLNLTVFNRKSLDDIDEGLKEVWASPFELRSFSWRQTLIDDPLWVLSSVVILEAVSNDKSGVLVTADVNTGDSGAMTVTTSEGVGGAVDGTSAETLLWSPQRVQLVTLFKSPWKNQLQPGGGSAIVPSSGAETVLLPDELQQIIGAGQKISAQFEPTRDPAGTPRPWDIEFGFKDSKLWLFQCRPFLGNDELRNLPALTPLEGSSAPAAKSDVVSLDEIVR
jgi:pyruvate phosphate dikinase-like enzyme